MGIISQIMSILEEVCFGPFFFQVAVMLRNSLFLSSILINSEVWYNLSNKNIQELEIVDHKLLRRVLECPQGTPTSIIRTGLCPIEVPDQEQKNPIPPVHSPTRQRVSHL